MARCKYGGFVCGRTARHSAARPMARCHVFAGRCLWEEGGRCAGHLDTSTLFRLRAARGHPAAHGRTLRTRPARTRAHADRGTGGNTGPAATDRTRFVKVAQLTVPATLWWAVAAAAAAHCTPLEHPRAALPGTLCASRGSALKRRRRSVLFDQTGVLV